MYVCVSVCVRPNSCNSVFPVKAARTRSNLSLIVCEMSFSRHTDGWRKGRYQNLLNILQVYTPLPHSKKVPDGVKVCVCVCEWEWEREIEVWQLPQWVPQDFTSWVFNCESWPFHANCTNTDTHWSRVRKWKKYIYKTENGCYSSLLQQQTQTWELNVLFSLDTDQNAFYGCLYLLASLRWPSWCHRQLCWFQGFNFFCRISDINHR